MTSVAKLFITIGCALAAAAVVSALPVLSHDNADEVCDETLSHADTAADRRRPIERRRAVQRFVNSLASGETGCLRRGTYVEDVAVSNRDVELRSYPGERARIVGRLWIRGAARDVTIRGLALDGRNAERLPSPTVNGDRTRFVGVDVTNRHTAICFIIGSREYGRASGTVIERSRIHDCGELPPDNTEHGIYVAAADDTRIVGNLIYENADRGIQLYPDAQRTVVRGNVIAGNGVGIIFSGDDRTSSNDNVVEGNVITHSLVRADVESYYPDGAPDARGNVVRNNCLYGGHDGEIDDSAGGFEIGPNTIADPRYADPERGDFTLDPRSPCARLLSAGDAD